MSTRPFLAIITIALVAYLSAPNLSRAETAATPAPAWCAPEVEALSDGVCHVDGGQRGERRALVIFLHGMIAKNTTWQWTQERALLRQAKEAGFEAIFPRAPLGDSGYAWPGSVKAQDEAVGDLVAGWRAARAALEERAGRPFDDVFVMGFSSGAYFASSLALRGLFDANGYAVFAGGAAYPARPGDSPHAVPVFVGVCADDSQTADDSRSVGAALTARGWPHRVDEQHVGHMFSDVHVVHAASYLRAMAARVAKPKGA
jgi:predicted esterase